MSVVRARVVAAFPRSFALAQAASRSAWTTVEIGTAKETGIDLGTYARQAYRLSEDLQAAFRAVAVLVEGVTDMTPVERALRKASLRFRVGGDHVLFVQTTRYDSGLMQSLSVGAPPVFDAVKRAVESFDASPPDLPLADGRRVPLRRRCHVMGVVNVTPDSFSDGGLFLDRDAAVKHALSLVEDGADLLDVGGESTRPGAEPVPADEEIRRVVPVIEEIARRTDTPVGVDTMKADVARAALDVGASIVNDVSAGRHDPAMLPLVAERGVPVVLMHMLGEPRTMQEDPTYRDVVGEIYAFLAERARAAMDAGVKPARILVDPGIGFGKTRDHNLTLLRRLRELTCLGHGVLVGTSRKSFIGTTLDLPVEERLEGTAATVALTVSNGAAVVRVHDVRAMRRVASMVEAVLRPGEP